MGTVGGVDFLTQMTDGQIVGVGPYVRDQVEGLLNCGFGVRRSLLASRHRVVRNVECEWRSSPTERVSVTPVAPAAPRWAHCNRTRAR